MPHLFVASLPAPTYVKALNKGQKVDNGQRNGDKGKALRGKGKSPPPLSYHLVATLTLFQRKKVARPEMAASLLATPRRRKLLDHA